MDGADVTNQTALYGGCVIKPGAVLGVFTFAEAGRSFPRFSITQARLWLLSGPLLGWSVPVNSCKLCLACCAHRTKACRSSQRHNVRQRLCLHLTVLQGPIVLSPGQPDPPAPASTQSTPKKVPNKEASKPVAAVKPSTAAAVYRGAAGEADTTNPAQARLVSTRRYLAFNLAYGITMGVLVPVQAVVLSAPFGIISVLLMFRLGWWAALLMVPGSFCLELVLMTAWMALVKV